MNKHYMKGVQKQKKLYLRLMDSKMVTAILALHFNGKEETTSLLFKEHGWK